MSEAKPMRGPLRVLWRIILTGHAAAAAGWMWMMPGGFPIGHARFWANRGLPLLVIVACVAGAWAGWRRRDALLRDFVLGVPMWWASAAVVGRVVFPISARWLWLPPLGVAALMGLLAVVTWLGRRHPRRRALLVVATAAVLGTVAPLTQRAGRPSTRPLGGPLGAPEGDNWPAGSAATSVPIEGGVVMSDGNGVSMHIGPTHLTVRPLLEFWSKSPDRCWTIAAPWRLRVEPDLVLNRGFHREGFAHLARSSEPQAELIVRADGGAVEIEAARRLDEPVYSHLNSFCKLEIKPLGTPALSFSPCPDAIVEVKASDYPVGRPARIAYLGADGMFRVVEARSGEKGPFRELAAGPMRRGDPLAITIHDGGLPLCRVTLETWAQQASTALSPTAGWGLPQNAIEFRLGIYGDVDIYITLAATSVGRGWDSVGHAAGTYRNRMRIEPVAESGPAAADGLQPAERRATGP